MGSVTSRNGIRRYAITCKNRECPKSVVQMGGYSDSQETAIRRWEGKFQKGQLRGDGSIGKLEGYCFVSAETIIDRLMEKGENMALTIGLSYKNPVVNDKEMDNISAIRWVNEHALDYTFEAYYTGRDELLHVSALSATDLF